MADRRDDGMGRAAGTELAGECTASTDRDCRSCVPGRFQARPSAEPCAQCAAQCEEGAELIEVCASDHDAQCSACPVGSFKRDASAVSFLLYTVTFHANLAHSLTRSP